MTTLVKTKTKIKKEHYVYIRGAIEDWEDYDDLLGLDPAEDDCVVVFLNTPGGDCAIGFHVIDHITSFKCHVHMVVEYPTYSMGAIMAVSGDSLSFMDDTYIMFHDYSGGAGGKGQETVDYTLNYREVFRKKFNRLCTPFLTRKESNSMFKGEDIYIHDTDPTLKKRIERHFK